MRRDAAAAREDNSDGPTGIEPPEMEASKPSASGCLAPRPPVNRARRLHFSLDNGLQSSLRYVTDTGQVFPRCHPACAEKKRVDNGSYFCNKRKNTSRVTFLEAIRIRF